MKTKLYFYTILHLRPKQIFYQLYYRTKRFFRKILRLQYSKTIEAKSFRLHLQASISAKRTYFPTENRFVFLNQSKYFKEDIDWNDEKSFGKLWAYQLNYFDFLHQKDLSKEEGLALINTFINTSNLSTGLEPYPISLRGINWIKFLTYHQIQETPIDAVLMAHYRILGKNLEYHILGNHLLENAFSLLFAAYYFRDKYFLKIATKLLKEELKEQILADGGHFELSPMYHQIVLFRLLDCLNLVKNNPDFGEYSINELLKGYAQKMLDFLAVITFENGDIPLVNDSAQNFAPNTAKLLAYAKSLNLSPKTTKIKESGYRKFQKATYELFVDVAEISPKYLSAHAHSDTLNFILYIRGKPFIVDTGTSTYQFAERRQQERSTAAHNTVQIGNFEQSEIWSIFRVARRAKPKILSESENHISASHNGYQRLGIVHQRDFWIEEQQITIRDRIFGNENFPAKAFLHFYPNIEITLTENTISTYFATIIFSENLEITLAEYLLAEEFNILKPAKLAIIHFQKELTTTIKFHKAYENPRPKF
ncbi:alginate lyase family protein [Arcicella rosea]|uniref:Heparinase II/III N-terminus n=1 Tax=Arcicella rosea TaxID=502909 RepID=A0A841EUV3_9BACT|nr:alginate lyase family protein [Arcicella rosea]MBB6005159.1 hypothetical protein [Arcicella rosea]